MPSPTSLSETNSSSSHENSAHSNSWESKASTNIAEESFYQNLSGDLPPVWGMLVPVDSKRYSLFSMRKDQPLTFGRLYSCSYTFDKKTHQLSDIEYFNISKTHFEIFREIDSASQTGHLVYIRDKSFNGTFINGKIIGKNQVRPLLHESVISLAAAENKAFIYLDRKVRKAENKDIPDGLLEKYTIEHQVKLGEGATGVVKRGYQNTDYQCKVAIKIVDKLKVLGSKDFGYEAKLLKDFSHANIVKVFNCYESNSHMYIIMENVRGGDLFNYIKKKGPVPERKSKEWFRQLLQAVKYLHDRNIIHRDLKPENILLDDKNDPYVLKIADFGLARFLSQDSLMNSIVGTPNYRAPEILNDDKGYDRKVDSWSLGCILSVLLLGYFPFRGGFILNEFEAGNTSEEAQDLLGKLLMVDPKQRCSIEEAIQHDWFDVEEPTTKRPRIET